MITLKRVEGIYIVGYGGKKWFLETLEDAMSWITWLHNN